MDLSNTTDQRSKILAIDDTPANLHLLIEIFNPREYIVFPARNGTVALSRLQSDLPDLILMDINMPEINGFELCRILKKDPKTRDIPVIFISGRDDSSAIIEGFAAGGVDYVTKPFKASEVLARANAHLMLKQYRELLKKQNLQLQDEILVRIAAEKELQKKNIELNTMLEDLKRAQSNLVLQAKMAGIGQLAAGVAHEINNPLGFIISNYSTLNTYMQRISATLETFDDDNIRFVLNDVQDILEESDHGLKRIRKIVAALLQFSSDGLLNTFHRSNLNEIIDITLEIAGSELLKTTEVDKQFSDLPEILANQGQISQALMNILFNAVQAIKDEQVDHPEHGGVIRIHTFIENEMIGCSISDNGVKIPLNVVDRMFEPFYTTRRIGEGTGIGLSTAYDIVVNRHDGQLTYSELPGGGKSFTILLPITPSRGSVSKNSARSDDEE